MRRAVHDNLSDSLKLNRERLARSRRAPRSTHESKYADAQSDCGAFASDEEVGENHGAHANVASGRSLQKAPEDRGAGRAAKASELLDFLDSVKHTAEGERDQTFRQLGPSAAVVRRRRCAKYDWEDAESDDDEEDEAGSCFGSGVGSDRAAFAPPPAPNGSARQASSPPSGTTSVSSRRSRTSSLVGRGDGLSVSSTGTSRSRLVTLKLEVEEKGKTIDALKQALDRARTEKASILERTNQESSHALEIQRKEHERAVARHLGFIDKLLADKKQLAAKVEELSSKVKRSEETLARRVDSLEEQHKREIARVKEAVSAADAQKRSKWQKEKARELKELTIKGLEPEIQSILAKHKEDLRAVEDKFKEEVRGIQAEHERERARAAQDLRSRHEIDLEEIRSKERTAMAAKLRQQETRHQEELTAQRQRFEVEFEDLRKRHKEEVDQTQSQLRARLEEAMEHKESELLEQKRRVELQLETLEQRWALEKEQWQAKLLRKFEERSAAEEQRIKEKLTAARDKQIDAVIGKLYGEQEAKLAQIEAQHKRDLEEAAARHKSALDAAHASAAEAEARLQKLKDVHAAEKRAHTSAEARVRELELLAEKRESRIVELSKKAAGATDMVAERERQVRSEYADRITKHIQDTASAHDKVEALRDELARATQGHKHELAQMRLGFEEETEEIHRRVRQTLARKDETIEALRAQLEDLEEQFDSYKEMMERQRKEFVG